MASQAVFLECRVDQVAYGHVAYGQVAYGQDSGSQIGSPWGSHRVRNAAVRRPPTIAASTSGNVMIWNV